MRQNQILYWKYIYIFNLGGKSHDLLSGIHASSKKKMTVAHSQTNNHGCIFSYGLNVENTIDIYYLKCVCLILTRCLHMLIYFHNEILGINK